MRDNIFKILGPVDGTVALAQFTPIINMPRRKQLHRPR